MKRCLSWLILFLCGACFAAQTVDASKDGTFIVRSDNGKWGGVKGVTGVLPLLGSSAIARKDFNLSLLQNVVKNANKAVLRMHLGIVDYSIYDKAKKSPGLNEKFSIAINDHVMEFSTADKRFPTTDDPRVIRRHEWMDFEFPAEWLAEKTTLSVKIRKLNGIDDHLYISIDPTAATAFSYFSINNGKKYSNSWFSSNGRGEYMIRLVITSPGTQLNLDAISGNVNSTFEPSTGKTAGDKLFAYTRKERDCYRMEFIPQVRDTNYPATLLVEGAGKVNFFDSKGSAIIAETLENQGKLVAKIPEKCDLFALECEKIPEKVSAVFTPSNKKLDPVRLQQAKISPVRGKREAERDSITVNGKNITVDNGALRLKFNWKNGFKVTEFFSYEAQCNMLASPEKFRLFIVRLDGKDYDIRNCNVKSVKKEKNGLAVTFEIPGRELFVKWFIRNEKQEFITSLDVTSTSAKVQKIKTVFPCLDGLKISEKVENDFYMFPTEGGYIGNAPCFRREGYGYGGSYCVIAVADLFSPEAGCGVYLRANDPKGEYKYFNIRKSGRLAKPGDKELRLWPILGRNDLSMLYGTSLNNDTPGTSFAIDYVERNCSKNESVSYPEAAIGAHEGDWHKAMEVYAAWSHKAFPRHKTMTPLANIWNCPGGWGTAEPLYPIYKSKNFPGNDVYMTEINGYWSVTDENIWNTGKITVKKGWIFKDPVTGKLVRSYNRGDYGNDGYNPQWGGLPALRKFLSDAQKRGKIVNLYTAPRIGDSMTKIGQKHGIEWCVINPKWHFRKTFYHPNAPTEPENLAFQYNAYRLCMENPDYQQWLIDNLVRLIKETGASGFRMDELGSPGDICLSTLHKHCATYRRGHNNHQQAISDMARRMRAKLTKECGPDKLMLTEFVGSDMFNASMDGALSWVVAINNYEVNPAPIHLFRFYFPGNKIFEIDEFNPGARKRKDWRYWLWNATGVYNSGLYPKNVHKLLQENTDAMGSGKATPMIPTLHPLILVNKFEAANGDVVWTILNTARNTYHGEIINVNAGGKQYKELLFNRELNVSDGKLITTIRPAEVLVIRETKAE